MQKTENWWEEIFSGTLEVGINKEKLTDVEQESFLYFDENEVMQEPHL